MPITKRFRTGLLVLISASLLVAAVFGVRSLLKRTPQGDGKAVVTLRLGYRPVALADVTPVIIKEGNMGSSQELKIELVPVSSPQDALQKFDAGEVDAIAGLTFEQILRRMDAKGDPGFKVYYFQVDEKGEGWVSIVAGWRESAKAVKDLAGKPVASLPTDQAKYLLRRILSAAGIADSDINIVQYNPASPLSGLESEEHAAIFGLEPALSRAIVKGGRILASGPVSEYLYGGKPVPVSASVVSKDFLSRHPEAVSQFLSIIDRAVEIQRNDPTVVRGYFAKQEYGGVEKDARDRLFMPVMRKPDPSLKQTTDQFISDLFSAGILKSKVDINVLLN